MANSRTVLEIQGRLATLFIPGYRIGFNRRNISSPENTALWSIDAVKKASLSCFHGHRFRLLSQKISSDEFDFMQAIGS